MEELPGSFDSTQAGREDADRFLSGDYDRDLEARSQLLDLETMPIISTVAGPAAAALIAEAVRCARTWARQWGSDDSQLTDQVQSWVYGFLMGHDYPAKKHGSLRT